MLDFNIRMIEVWTVGRSIFWDAAALQDTARSNSSLEASGST